MEVSNSAKLFVLLRNYLFLYIYLGLLSNCFLFVFRFAYEENDVLVFKKQFDHSPHMW